MSGDIQSIIEAIEVLPKTAGVWRDAGNGHLWLDHMTLHEDALPRLLPARRLTMWNVKVPAGLYGQLPNLEELVVEGGSGRDLLAVSRATELKRLVLNQIRGVTDLSWLPGLRRLQSLALYGLPRVTSLPSLAGLTQLRFVQVGQMVRLHDLTGVAAAPGSRELRFTQRLGVDADSMRPFAGHPTLERFGWSWEEGVPASQAQAVLGALPLPRPDWDAPDLSHDTR